MSKDVVIVRADQVETEGLDNFAAYL